MVRPTSSSFYISIIFILSLLILPSDALRKVTVVIENDLGDAIPLHVHCKSKDDDLGPHHLNFGEQQSWTFTPNFFYSTLFWCNMQWKSAQGWVTGSFNVYDGKYDDDRCAEACAWSIRTDGAYRLNPDNNEFQLVHPWWG